MPNPRKLLYPFSVLYHAVTGVRNFLYDTNYFKSESFDVPVICVGNLSVGGTGKSPMIEYLVNNLQSDYKIAILSRGYKRESSGFKLVKVTDNARAVGDEPLQFKTKFPGITVAVDANRREGIEKLLKNAPDIILLDDAFQHRKLKASVNIVLTPYNDLYIDDLLLPAGNLRESASGIKRADHIIVTKCPLDLSREEMKQMRNRISPLYFQKLFFTGIGYSEDIVSGNGKKPISFLRDQDFTLVTGIANPLPLKTYLENLGLNLCKHLEYPDHHNFSERELNSLQGENLILTTEKDYMRLRDSIAAEKLYYLPIQVKFLNNESRFLKDLNTSIHKK